VRSWCRIGTHGQELVEVFATEIEVGEVLEAIALARTPLWARRIDLASRL
jgi:predicted DNA-binding WGR domain protein